MRIISNLEEGLVSDDCKKGQAEMTELINDNCDQQIKEDLANAFEKHLSDYKIKPASNFQSKQNESEEILNVLRGGDEEVQVRHINDESQTNYGLVGEEMESIYGSKMFDSQGDIHSDEEIDDDEGKEMLDISALASLLNAATNFDSEYGSSTTQYARPAVTPSNLCASSEEKLSDEEKMWLWNLQQLKVKFLRLVHRLGYTVESPFVAQVMYKLTVFPGRPRDPAFSFDDAKQKAVKLEGEGNYDLNISVNILVLGKTGVGKSTTINSIFGEEKVKIDAFKPGTTSVQEICGVVDGVKVRVVDMPGLKSSVMEQGFNNKVLAKVKKFVKKYPPDVVLYVDRLDSQTRYFNDVAMLRTVTRSLGSSIWKNAILTLTHAGSSPPDGTLGTPVSYDTYVTRVSQVIQQSIVAAVDDYSVMDVNTVMPVSLVENHSSCKKNVKGEKVLPNGETWRNHLLLQCYSRKLLSEATSASKPQGSFRKRFLSGFLKRTPPLAYLVGSFLTTRAHPKLPVNQGGIPDVELGYLSDSELKDEEDEYDQLPPFRPLRKVMLSKLSKDQRKAYFDEYDYRVKLLQKKQWREQCRLLKELKKQGKSVLDDYTEMLEMFDVENEPSSSAPPEIISDRDLPLSFDSDNPTYRYRSLEDPNPMFSVMPFNWDHDYGYNGVSIQRYMGIAGTFPAELEVQLSKDKDVFKIYLNSAISAKHGESNSSLVGFEVQTIEDQLAYILRGESKIKISKKNRTTAGLSVFLLGDDVVPGVKVEHEVNLGKRIAVTGKTGTVCHQKNAAYEATLEVRLRGADYPVEPVEHLVAVNMLKYRGDMAIEVNIQPQFRIGRNSKMAVNFGLNTRNSGQIIVTTSSSNPIAALLGTLVSMMVASYYNYKAWCRLHDSENYYTY